MVNKRKLKTPYTNTQQKQLNISTKRSVLPQTKKKNQPKELFNAERERNRHDYKQPIQTVHESMTRAKHVL